MRPFVLAAIVVVATAQRAPDPLPRRGYFGVGLEQSAAGVRVTGVTPGSTAAAVGIAAGDFITAVDGRPADTTDAVISAIGQHRSGESVSIRIRRDGENRTIAATLKAYPSEQMQNATVSYASVVAQPGVRLRTIVSVPVTPSRDRYPAVLLVQGGGCGSIDAPIGPPVAQPGLMHVIGSQGFVTMRVEKSGVGDSQGEPCASIGFAEELAGYRAALRALQSHPAVDRERIYLVGISLGGLFAPLLAAETQVAGISVYGTPAGPTPVYPGRSDRFFQEMARVDIPAAWAMVHTRVQVLHGEYDVDPVINRAAHEAIALMVNRANPGTAQFKELEGLDHCWTRHDSLEASKDKCGQGQDTRAFQDAVLRFLSGQL
jgi:dienelactone hydrolase